MNEDAIGRLSKKLGWYQALAVGSLAFIVLFSITIMGVMIFLAFSVGRQSAKLESVAQETHGALCAFKGDLQTRHSTTLALLRDNPSGLPGITRYVIQQALDTQETTLGALKILTCP